MKKFRRSINGYNVDEVNHFLDDIIRKVESIIKEEEMIKKQIIDKDNLIKELESTIEQYKNTSTVNSQEEIEYLKRLAKTERDDIINDARKNANRIISDALLRAEKTEYQAELLKKNIKLYKSKVRVMLNQQLDLVDDLDEIELD